MLPRLVATDLDGTLLRPDGTVSPRTVQALRRARAAGAHVVAVTGRPVRWMAALADAVEHQGTAICSNGAAVYDLAARRLTETFPIAPERVLAVAAALREVAPDVSFAVESASRGFRHEPAYVRNPVAGVGHEPSPTGPLAELVTDDVLKLMARVGAGTPEAFLAAAQPATSGLAELTHSTTAPFLEISALGVSKASTLARVAAGLGIEAADVVAFGDMPNDLALLAWAGRSWATANAHPLVLAAAHAVTGSHEDDGVAAVLEDLFAAAP